MHVSYCVLFFQWTNALPVSGGKASEDADVLVMQRNAQDPLFDDCCIVLPNLLDSITSMEPLIDFASDDDIYTNIPPEIQEWETPILFSDHLIPSSEDPSLAFEMAFIPEQDSNPEKPACSSLTAAACCVRDSMFTSCVWWSLDRIFCEDPANYACCESIQDYVGSNCEHIGEEGKDWDWLEDIYRSPILTYPFNLLNSFSRLWFPEGV